MVNRVEGPKVGGSNNYLQICTCKGWGLSRVREHVHKDWQIGHLIQGSGVQRVRS